uniref:Uncharacterized protein n=1 Tax=Caenorhabditis japonica TaxID=281687 RepID=A0A8R1ECR3_CAEJA
MSSSNLAEGGTTHGAQPPSTVGAGASGVDNSSSGAPGAPPASAHQQAVSSPIAAAAAASAKLVAQLNTAERWPTEPSAYKLDESIGVGATATVFT